MLQDTARLMNDITVVVGTVTPDVDMHRILLRLEEVLANYQIHRKTALEAAEDLPEKIELYLSSKKLEGLSERTLGDYRMELILFSTGCQKATSQVSTGDIRNYLSSLDNVMVSTIGKKLSVLKSFFGWLVQEEVILRDPTSKIKLPKTPNRLRRGLSIEELEMVRESCETLRQRALMEVLYSTGCRVTEVSNMDKSDINNQDMSVRVIGKGDKERIVYLSFKALYHLNKYLKTRNDNVNALFVTKRKPYGRLSRRAIQNEVDKIEHLSGIQTVLTPHIFRHTFAMLARDAGIELSDLQHLMGHSDPATTLIYTSVSEERKQQAFKRYHAQ